MRAPHVLLTLAEVEQAVDRLLEQPMFVIDVETTWGTARTNEVRWVGLGALGMLYLIPLQHPQGLQLVPEHKEKTPAFILFGADDSRSMTPGGKPSMRMVEHTVPAVFASPPKQLYADAVFAALKPLLFSDRAKIGHNVKFDLQSIAKYYGGVIPPGPYHDTIIVRHIIDESQQEYGLKWLTCEWFKIPYKEREKFYPNLGKQGVEHFGLDQVARYLAKDVFYCWRMFQRWYPMLERRGLQGVYDFEMSVYPVIMEMEQDGFPVNFDRMDIARRDLEEQIKVVEQQCFIMAGDEFSLSDPDAKRWVMFGEARKNALGHFIPEYGKAKRELRSQRLRVLVRTKETQQPSMTAAVLEYWAERGNKMAEFMAEWALLEKLRGTFIGAPAHIKEEFDHKLRKTVPVPYAATGLYQHAVPHKDRLPTVHTGYKQHGTVTGRLSSNTPNLQQLPRGSRIRDLFVADEGYMLIVADYDQVELRCAGYLSKDRNMIRVFREGHDVHAQAAAAMFQIRLEDVTPEMRAVGKTQNFAVLYGAGPDKIAAVAGCSKQRALALLRGYFEAFPALEAWKKRELNAARERGDRADPLHTPPHVVIPPVGRLRRLPELYELTDDWVRWRAERQAINAIVQGFASNITKLAMLALDKSLPPEARMLAQVHDEIVFRVREDSVDSVLPLVTRIMGGIVHPETGDAILGEIPLVASAATGNSWAQAKGKG